MNDDILAGFPIAAPWSLSAGQAGRGFVYAGIAFFVAAGLCWVLQGKSKAFTKFATPLFCLGALSLFATMACLISLFATDQFQYQYVFAHGDVHTALKYKVAGVWSGQQGSFLLWACTSAIFGLLAMPGAGSYRRWFGLTFAVFLGSLCGILAYETPFGIIPDVIRNGQVLVPPTGQGLVPSLQNYWVVIHPPTIFMGFGSLTVLFAYAVAAIAGGNLKDWIPRVRPWALVSLSVLGVGLCMGGFWAYETLGWGGFWAWDPVENTSFVPWIFVAAFVHGIIVQVSKNRWHGANLWLGALPFLSFVYGTYLTRSGYLSDVSLHSFAEMNKSALIILLILLCASVVTFLLMYFLRGLGLAKTADQVGTKSDGGISREGAYGFGVLMLTLLSGVIALGMSWPLILAFTGHKIAAVEEGLYHRVIVWFFVPLMLLMAAGPFITWRGLPPKAFLMRIINVFSVSIGVTGFALILINNPRLGIPVQPGAVIDMPFKLHVPLEPWIGFLLFLCIFVAVSSVWRTVELMRRSPTGVGGFIAHLGLATLLAGLIISRGFEQKQRIFLRQDEPETALGYTIKFERMTGDLHDRANKVAFDVTSPDGQHFEATPGLYYLQGDEPSTPKAMVWPHIERQFSHDIYLSMGEPQIFAWKNPVTFQPGETKTVDGVTVRYVKPTVTGTPGQMGTKFGALLDVDVDGKSYSVEPQMVVGVGPTMPELGKDLRMTMIKMNAADRSIDIQLLFSSPIYPIDLYYKPMTVLVFSGCGILALGGLLSAFSRRRAKLAAQPNIDDPMPQPATEPRSDARLISPEPKLET